MFWTNLVKGLGKIAIGLGFIGSIIGGIAAGKGADNGLIGFLVIIIGIVFTFIGMTGVMMICEISQNIAETRKILENQNQNSYSGNQM